MLKDLNFSCIYVKLNETQFMALSNKKLTNKRHLSNVYMYINMYMMNYR